VTLVDTSVWVNHLRANDVTLATLLDENRVLMHPMVIGELACGNLRDREYVLGLLKELPRAPMADDDEALFFIEGHRLMGRGIGYIDAHLLAAASLVDSALLWTDDRRLRNVAMGLGLAYQPPALGRDVPLLPTVAGWWGSLTIEFIVVPKDVAAGVVVGAPTS
jgi:predicted nucleic acid-binding protein